MDWPSGKGSLLWCVGVCCVVCVLLQCYGIVSECVLVCSTSVKL